MKQVFLILSIVVFSFSCVNHRSVVDTFLSENGFEDVNSLNSEGYTSLCKALESDDYVIAESLLLAGADINRRNGEGLTPLLNAVNKENRETVNFLLSKGADPNQCDDKTGISPLQTAIEKGNADIIESLIAAGVDHGELYVIDKGRVGTFRLEMTRNNFFDLVNIYDSAVLDSFIINNEGVEELIYIVVVDAELNSSIEFVYDISIDGFYKIEINSGKFRTRQNLGIGSTYCEISEIYGEIIPEWGDNGEPVIIVEEENVTFVLSEGDWWLDGKVRKGADVSGTEVESMFIW
ncbi:ankyrin repeat domain-containing protein [candidate division WOR-3 bacterium]|nr:ankyrin repeat domain-containing protein [candidate division WOR-3 bacterium]